jgi:hypothetical protein
VVCNRVLTRRGHDAKGDKHAFAHKHKHARHTLHGDRRGTAQQLWLTHYRLVMGLTAQPSIHIMSKSCR